jgi:hypothetical protein
MLYEKSLETTWRIKTMKKDMKNNIYLQQNPKMKDEQIKI